MSERQTILAEMIEALESNGHNVVVRIDRDDPKAIGEPGGGVIAIILGGDVGPGLLITVGWGSSGVHADIEGYLYGEPVPPMSLPVLDTTMSVYVQDPTAE